ncbi:Photosystem I P700 chlorophyll a apoprotein A2 [Enhygromyxa salina]|uniref:Photosystem I P700 chlorophyll a apoprotein A2 n=1 Tax=Enhygromyxa salina TaxID=215803 RepID=A0A2S9XHR2_9BACT|nr:OmpA family protein [Enhygromyxa salina]PRP92424.1 Photosystem I P700 chlorophyll a apoprotein A2 [Enhygromyxa salina]
MRQHRKHPRTVGITLATAFLALPALACGPTIFADTDALTVIGEPPPPPPEPEPEPEPPPKPKRVEVTAAAIVINDKILFEVDKAVIRAESFDLMNEITQVVKENPRIKKISIEGHTDDDGSKNYNKKLSQKRADSVMSYLVEHGIEAERLTAVGHGEDIPIVANDSPENKEKNRRVEFIIVEQEEVKNVVEIDPETGEERVVESKAVPQARVAAPDTANKGEAK